MDKIPDYLKFTTIEDGKKMLSNHLALRDKMEGALYYLIANEECEGINLGR